MCDDDGGRYRYESLTSGFTAALTVDSEGVVREYPGLFRCVLSIDRGDDDSLLTRLFERPHTDGSS